MMNRFRLWALLAPGLGTLLAGCSAAPTPTPAPAQTSESASCGFANPYEYGTDAYYVVLRWGPEPACWGDVNDWYWRARQDGLAVDATPEAGAIAWTTDSDGNPHVAYVEKAGNGQVKVSEMGHEGWNRVSYRLVAAGTFKYYIR